jgi:mRNA-degrading endonuclease RelE of RelBE toxin-antitoxin system
MDHFFKIVFPEEAFRFLNDLDKKHYEKILFNIRKAQIEQDPTLFKKLKEDIWEFRTLYQGIQFVYLHFGTNQNLKRHWLLQHMELSKNEVKFQKPKFYKQSN